MDSYFGDFRLICLIFRRSLAGIYCVAFLSALVQLPALLGERGLLPVPEFLRRSSLRQSPSIFHLAYSDTIFTIVASLGIVVSVTALLGVSERGPFWVSMAGSQPSATRSSRRSCRSTFPPRSRGPLNYSYNRLHLINAYSAFGSVTRTRYEIVIEGTDDPVLLPQTRWKEYEFKGKPGGVMRRPPQVAPYHLRLDWLMWFLPLAVRVSDSGIVFSGHTLWFLRLVKALLEGDRKTLRLLRRNPFPDAPPRLVRARFYRYRFTSRREKRDTGEWWVRTLIDDYLPPVGLADLRHM